MLQQPTVHILLATYNGARYLDEQLQSIARQTYSAWTLTVSDDGSTDDTLLIVQRFAIQVTQPVSILQGPKRGSPTANFCHLIALAPADNPEDLYAFCDQDDLWYAEKLQRAVQWHTMNTCVKVRLYCGRSQIVNADLKPIDLSPRIKRPASFENALVQNIASGNTMVFSNAVLTSQKRILPNHSVWHDWTTYLVATALVGLVWFDEQPCLFYRQHDKNVIGSNDNFMAQIARLKPLLSGRFKCWANMNCAAMNDIQNSLPCESVKTLRTFIAIRSATTVLTRVSAYLRSGIRRQRTTSNALLALAFAFKLI